jgi:hypothetical protein
VLSSSLIALRRDGSPVHRLLAAFATAQGEPTPIDWP